MYLVGGNNLSMFCSVNGMGCIGDQEARNTVLLGTNQTEKHLLCLVGGDNPKHIFHTKDV